MAVQQLCDRCGRVIDRLENFLHMRRWERPRFTGLLRRKRTKEMWGEFPQDIDLCDNCTKEFFKFVEGGTMAKNEKQNTPVPKWTGKEDYETASHGD